MSVRMRSTHGHTANRRSHHRAASARLATCDHCSTPHVKHHVCMNCGRYRGHEIVNVAARQEKRAAKVAARTGQQTKSSAETPPVEEGGEQK